MYGICGSTLCDSDFAAVTCQIDGCAENAPAPSFMFYSLIPVTQTSACTFSNNASIVPKLPSNIPCMSPFLLSLPTPPPQLSLKFNYPSYPSVVPIAAAVT